MAKLRFEAPDQEAFAALCGDRNPIHLDAAVARRSPFGARIVHGCHLALAAMEATLADQPAPAPDAPGSITATFSRPVAVAADVTVSNRRDGERLRIEVADAGGATTTVVVDQHTVSCPDDFPVPPLRDQPAEPLDTQPAPGLRGTMALGLDHAEAAARFPHVLAWLGAHRLASLAAISTVVGMHCPGRRSILSAWTAGFLATELPPGACTYEVTAFDDRFGMVTLEVCTATMRATVKAFVRPDTVQQPTAAELQTAVQPHEFAAVRALVIGGARGLGEVAAKLLALGGAQVTITYREGATDAQRIVDELSVLGRTVTAVHYDVAEPEQLPHAVRQPNVLA